MEKSCAAFHDTCDVMLCQNREKYTKCVCKSFTNCSLSPLPNERIFCDGSNANKLPALITEQTGAWSFFCNFDKNWRRFA